MSGKFRCILCRRRQGVIVPLPITGQYVALCDRCRGPRFLAHMQTLLPHG